MDVQRCTDDKKLYIWHSILSFCEMKNLESTKEQLFLAPFVLGDKESSKWNKKLSVQKSLLERSQSLISSKSVLKKEDWFYLGALVLNIFSLLTIITLTFINTKKYWNLNSNISEVILLQITLLSKKFEWIVYFHER